MISGDFYCECHALFLTEVGASSSKHWMSLSSSRSSDIKRLTVSTLSLSVMEAAAAGEMSFLWGSVFILEGDSSMVMAGRLMSRSRSKLLSSILLFYYSG